MNDANTEASVDASQAAHRMAAIEQLVIENKSKMKHGKHRAKMSEQQFEKRARLKRKKRANTKRQYK